MWRPLMVVGLAVSLPSAVYSSEDEFRLLQDLRKSYDPFERPVHNSSLPLTVKIRVYLQQILDVDEKNQVISMAVWLQYVRISSILALTLIHVDLCYRHGVITNCAGVRMSTAA
uniref:Neurotransmitter-gated ion-channel ligand-binding domain-containing protein n=1 Tax=Plectus sambesii TaxID=2011161 RepID=A0A914VQ29_9BILA